MSNFFSSWISNEALERCKHRIELIANTLQLEGFSRIDAFLNVDSGEVCSFHILHVPLAESTQDNSWAWFCCLFCLQKFSFVIFIHHPYRYLQVLIIEVNTVPGMTPSTVLIHQVALDVFWAFGNQLTCLFLWPYNEILRFILKKISAELCLKHQHRNRIIYWKTIIFCETLQGKVKMRWFTETWC